MSKLNKILLGLIGLLIIGSLIFLGVKSLSSNKTSNYYAVYMTSGDIYFGILHRFPKLSLSNAYTLQRTEDKKTPFTLVKFGDAFWGPQGDIELGEANVLWVAGMNSDSQVVKSIKEKLAGK